MQKVFLLLALAVSMTADAQSSDRSDKTAAVKALVESRNYVFKPQTAIPLTGRTRELTYDYRLAVTPGSIVSELPYFGRAYAPVPYNPTQSPMSFTSKSFDYTLTPRKKGGWDVTIKPKDLNGNIQQLYLTISVDGYASLRILSTNRDAISYNGTISPPQRSK